MSLVRGAVLGLAASCATLRGIGPQDLQSAADLRPALPPTGLFPDDQGCALGACGETGRGQRLSLNPRATAVAALYERYLRAVFDRSVDALRPLLADYVSPSEGSSPGPHAGQPREVVLAAHQRLFQTVDTGQRPFSALFSPPVVLSAGGPNGPLGLRARDYSASGDTRGFRRAANMTLQLNVGMPANLTLVVRWIDDDARIVGISSSILAFRP